MKNFKRVLAVVLVALVVLLTFAACGKSPERAIVGTWRDSTNSKGYEFREDKTCVIKYSPDFVIPIIGYKHEGDLNGVYTVEEAEDGTCYVTISYTLYSQTITNKYIFNVDGASLTLTNVEDQTQTVYMAYEETTTETETTAIVVS